MKKLLAPFILLTALSCQLPLTPISRMPEAIPVPFDTFYDAQFFVGSKMRYVPDTDSHASLDYWQSPRETVERMTGDCEDFAILTLYYAHSFGIEGTLVIVRKGSARHAVLMIGGVLISGQGPGGFDEPGWTQIDEYSLEQALARCASDGSY